MRELTALLGQRNDKSEVKLYGGGGAQVVWGAGKKLVSSEWVKEKAKNSLDIEEEWGMQCLLQTVQIGRCILFVSFGTHLKFLHSKTKVIIYVK